MDSTLQLILAGALILVLGGLGYLQFRREMQIARGGPPPLSKVAAVHNNRARMQAQTEYVRECIAELRQIPWGQQAVNSANEGQRLYDEGMAISTQAEGDHEQLAGAIERFVHCPPALAYSGAAEVMRRLSYVGGDDSVPLGIQEAGRYTSLAIANDPGSAEAWLMRVRVFCTAPDRIYRKVAEYALEQARQIAPAHPRLAFTSAAYYKVTGDKAAREEALITATQTAPTQPERLAAFDRLALEYLAHRQLDEAISTYQRALTEFPQGTAWVWHNYSVVLQRAGRYQEALQCSDRALTFFEFPRARQVNNELRAKLGLVPGTV